MTSFDETLLSMEKLDRTSPELWPEKSEDLCDIFFEINSTVVAGI